MRTISTKLVTQATLTAGSEVREMVRAIALLYYLSNMTDEDDENQVEKALTILVGILAEQKDAYGKGKLGIPVKVTTAFTRQMKAWLSGDLDWEDEAQYERYESAVSEFLLYHYEIFVETNVGELTPERANLVAEISEEERSIIHSMTGMLLGMGRKYNTARMIENTLLANAQIFSEDLDIYKKFVDPLFDEGYFRPDDYTFKLEYLATILKRNEVETVDQDPYLPTAKGRHLLKENNPADYAIYVEMKKYILDQANRAILGDLVADSVGVPQIWSKVYARVTSRSDAVYIPRDFFAGSSWTGLVRAIKVHGDKNYSIQHLSPFGEPLKQNPVGNIVMNPNYESGSTEFVATYVVPNSKGSSKVYVYTVGAVRVKNKERFDSMREILQNLDTYRNKWAKDLKAFARTLSKYDPTTISKDATKSTKKSVTPPTAEQWRRGMLAMLCEIGYQAAPRTGEKGNSTLMSSGQRQSTYALTTLKIGHVHLTPESLNPLIRVAGNPNRPKKLGDGLDRLEKLVFMYKGKAAEPQQHIFTRQTKDGDSLIRSDLMSALGSYINLINMSVYEDKSEATALDVAKQNFFRIPTAKRMGIRTTGGWIVILNRHVNQYLKRDLKFPDTFKVFRKLRATSIFMNYMDSLGDGLNAETINHHVNVGAAMAGSELGHAAAKSRASGTMALQHYIDAQTILGYYATVQASPSKKIANTLKYNLSESKND